MNRFGRNSVALLVGAAGRGIRLRAGMDWATVPFHTNDSEEDLRDAFRSMMEHPPGGLYGAEV